jgi:hypothetical protein
MIAALGHLNVERLRIDEYFVKTPPDLQLLQSCLSPSVRSILLGDMDPAVCAGVPEFLNQCTQIQQMRIWVNGLIDQVKLEAMEATIRAAVTRQVDVKIGARASHAHPDYPPADFWS